MSRFESDTESESAEGESVQASCFSGGAGGDERRAHQVEVWWTADCRGSGDGPVDCRFLLILIFGIRGDSDLCGSNGSCF